MPPLHPLYPLQVQLTPSLPRDLPAHRSSCFCTSLPQVQADMAVAAVAGSSAAPPLHLAARLAAAASPTGTQCVLLLRLALTEVGGGGLRLTLTQVREGEAAAPDTHAGGRLHLTLMQVKRGGEAAPDTDAGRRGGGGCA